MKRTASSLFSSLHQRRGFEIAVSTLVVMILGLVIVGGGIILVAKLRGSGEGVVNQLSADSIAQLRSLMNKGSLVAVYPANQRITAGKTAIVGGMVQNRLDAKIRFNPRVTGKDDAESLIGPPEFTWITLPFDLEQNEEKEFPIVVKIKDTVPAGTYYFLLNVTYDVAGTPTTYDSVRQFTLRVD